jgi:beta-fructofuranosidase
VRRRISSNDAGGAVVYLKSTNLLDWREADPLLLVASDEFYQMEVPQVFWRRDGELKRFYLIFSAQDRDCSPVRRARLPESECRTGTYFMLSDPVALDYKGIPELRSDAHLLAQGLYAGKLLEAETADHPIFLGFHWADEEGRFIGGISDPLATRFADDGRIELCDAAWSNQTSGDG